MDNEGPGTGSATSGKGYGGGQGYHYTGGNPGVILIEVKGPSSGQFTATMVRGIQILLHKS